MECQAEKLEHFRHILLFDFSRGEAAWNILHRVWGQYNHRARQKKKWFSRFKVDRFDISDTPRSGKPSEFDEDRLNALIQNEPRECTWELTNVMNRDHFSIVRHLYSMGKIKKIECMGTHALSQNHKNQRVAIFPSLLPRHRLAREQHRPVLSCIVTGDKK